MSLKHQNRQRTKDDNKDFLYKLDKRFSDGEATQVEPRNCERKVAVTMHPMYGFTALAKSIVFFVA